MLVHHCTPAAGPISWKRLSIVRVARAGCTFHCAANHRDRSAWSTLVCGTAWTAGQKTSEQEERIAGRESDGTR